MKKYILFFGFIFCTLHLFAQKLLPIEQKNKWGMIDFEGNEVIKPAYEQALNVNSQNQSIAILNGKYGVIDKKGNVLLSFQNQELMWLNDTLLASKKDSLWGVIKLNGKWIIPAKYRDLGMENGFIKVFSKGSQGVFSLNGKMLIAPVLFKVEKQKHFFVVTDKRMKSGLFSLEGKELVNISSDSINIQNDSLCFFKNKNGWSWISHKKVNKVFYKQIKYLKENILAFKSKKTNLFALYDLRTDKVQTDSVFSNPILFDNEYIVCKNGKNTFLFDSQLKLIFQKEVMDIHSLGKGLFANKNHDFKYDLYNLNTNYLLKLDANQIDRFVYACAAFKKDTLWGLINIHGKVLFEAKFSKIELGEGFAKLYKGESHEMIFFDNQGNIKEEYANVHTLHIAKNKNLVTQKGNHHLQVGCFEMVSHDFATIHDKAYDLYQLKEHCSKVSLSSNYKFFDIRLQDFAESNVALSWLENGVFTLCHKNGTIQSTINYNGIHYHIVGLSKFKNGFAVISLSEMKTISFPNKQNNIGKLEQGIDFQYDNKNVTGLINIDGKFIIPPTLKAISLIDNNLLVIENKEHQKYLADTLGNRIGNLFSSFVQFNHIDSLFVVGEQKKEVGILDKQGSIVANCNYDDVLLPYNQIYALKKNAVWQLVNLENGKKTAFEFDDVKNFSSDLIPVKKGKKWGYVNRNFEKVVDYQFDNVSEFFLQHAIVVQKNEHFLMNKKGELKSKIECSEAMHFDHTFAWVKQNHLWGAIDTNARWIISPKYKKVSAFNQFGLAEVENEAGQFLLINKAGNHVSMHTFDKIEPFKNAYAIVKQGLNYGLIDSLGGIVLHCVYKEVSNVSEGYTLVKDENGKYFFVEMKSLSKLEVKEYEKLSFYNEGLALTKKGKEELLINTKGLPEITLNSKDYETIGGFNEAKILLREKWTGKVFFMHKTGELQPSHFFDEAYPFQNQVSIAKDSLWGLVSETGTLLTDFQYSEIQSFDNKFFTKFFSSAKYGLINKKGLEKIKMEAEKIELIEGYILKVEIQNSIRYFNLKTNKWLW